MLLFNEKNEVKKALDRGGEKGGPIKVYKF